MILEQTTTHGLASRLDQALREASRFSRPILVSSSERLSPFDPIQVFGRAGTLTTTRAFWAQPDGELSIVGVGAAHVIESRAPARFQQASAAWRSLLKQALYQGPRAVPGVGPLLLGGFSFDAPRAPTRLWQNFPHARLILPRLIFVRYKNEFWLTRNIVVDSETDVEFETLTLNALASSLSEPNGASPDTRRQGRPNPVPPRELDNAAAWQKLVGDAVQTIRRGEMEKVVLARAVELQSPHPFHPPRVLDHFSKHAPGCYLFALARETDCFLGATPEQLVRVRDGKLETMSLAGSMPRGTTPRQDAELGQALLASAKDRSEHAIVVRDMLEALGTTCAQLRFSETPTLLKLGSIQHLCTRFDGGLADGHTLLDFVERLHPTPAVGGRPRRTALEWIREREGLDRGWYAGAVGWMDAQFEGEFVVAIRSALLQENRATLFAGCGIVADSDPEREYAEATLKFKPMLAALTAL